MSMNKNELENKLNNFIEERIDQLSKAEQELEKVRIEFVKDYPISKIGNLELYEYVSGIKKSKLNYSYRTFCYRIETELRQLGSINGSFAQKFGIYYSSSKHDYVYVPKFGDTVVSAFKSVKLELCKLIIAGSTLNFVQLNDNLISKMYACKILATYYPDKFICIGNDEHINEFLEILGIAFNKKSSIFEKNVMLVNWKNTNKITKDWTNYIFMRFLYDEIGLSNKQQENDKEAQKQADKNYPSEYKFKSNITTQQWEEMIKNKEVFHDEDIELLSKFYNCDNHASTCYNLGIIYGVEPQSFISPVVHLAKRVLDYTGEKPHPRENKHDRYWSVLFWGRYTENGLFEWKIRPRLANALIKIYPNIESKIIDDELDLKLNEDIKSIQLTKKSVYSYSSEVKEVPVAVYIKGNKTYKRDRTTAINALGIADFKCEIDKNHKTFIRKRDGLPYTEPHHLIPMAYQYLFDVSIDIEENIVSLCSNCHNEIHYGDNANKLIEKLFNERKDMLEGKGIYIDLDKLLSFYGYE